MAELAQHGVTPATTYEEFKAGFLASRPMGYGSHSLLARGLYALQVRVSLCVCGGGDSIWSDTGGGVAYCPVSRFHSIKPLINQQSTRHTTMQLQPWLAAFPREQLLVLFMDDMCTPEATHAQVGKVGR